MQWLKQNTLNIALTVLVAFTVAYLFSYGFREKITDLKIDAGMVTGLITSFALLLGMRQWARDKNFAYRLSVKNNFEQMGQLVIAKLYCVDARRQACVSTLQHLKQALETGVQYRDGYNITSTDAFNSDNCLATAALDVYFPDQGDKWNEVIETLNEMGSLASTALLNYFENDYGKKTTNFLSNLDKHIVRMDELNEKIANKPKEIRDGVIEEVNKHTLNIGKV